MKKLLLLLALVSFTMNAQVTIFEDGFESYDDFAITAIGDWTQIDLDASATYGSTDYDFTNSAYIGTGIVFNPSMTTPAATGTVWDVRTGDKGLYFFAATSLLNDDYMISPQMDLTGATGSAVSFWAKSLTDTYGLERFEVLLSTTGTAVADFTVDLGGGELQAPVDVYTEYAYDLSAYDGQQVYIAIHYTAQDSFVFQVDDFLVEAVTVAGIEDLQALDFFYGPNPVQNSLNMKANTAIDNVSVLNLLGQQVLNAAPSKMQTSIDFSELNSGVYLVNVQIGNTSGTFKVVKE